MVTRVYVLVVTFLLLVALAVAIPVLVNIVREGRERQRKWREGEMERYTEDPVYEAGPAAVLDDDVPPGMVACPNCGTENDDHFSFCRECAGPL